MASQACVRVLRQFGYLIVIWVRNIFLCNQVTTYSAMATGTSEDEANRRAFEELCNQMNEDGFLDGLSSSRCLSALFLYDFENDCTRR